MTLPDPPAIVTPYHARGPAGPFETFCVAFLREYGEDLVSALWTRWHHDGTMRLTLVARSGVTVEHARRVHPVALAQIQRLAEPLTQKQPNTRVRIVPHGYDLVTDPEGPSLVWMSDRLEIVYV